MREKQGGSNPAALSFPGLDQAIVSFIETGQLDSGASHFGASFMQAFEYVGRTRIGRRFGVKATSSRLYVSGEFCRTVTSDSMIEKSEFLRPVNWILWSPSPQTGLIIIPEEAEAVIPRLRQIIPPLVWLLGSSAPVTKSMRYFNNLAYLTVSTWPRNRGLPTWLGIEVGILSGRFFFEFSEYKSILCWLGILLIEQQQPDFPTGPAMGEPLQFLQGWIVFRRHTDDIQHTPVGSVCQRQHLHECHFFFLFHDIPPSRIAQVGLDITQREETVENDGLMM